MNLCLNSPCFEWIFNYHLQWKLKCAALEKQLACQGPLNVMVSALKIILISPTLTLKGKNEENDSSIIRNAASETN